MPTVSMAGRRSLAAVVALVVAAVAAFGALSADARRATKHVALGDDYFLPENVRIHKGGKVRWEYVDGVEAHNVYLKRAPDGVRKARYRSPDLLFPGDAFTRRFKKRGRYHFICTYHPTVMQMDVRVRR